MKIAGRAGSLMARRLHMSADTRCPHVLHAQVAGRVTDRPCPRRNCQSMAPRPPAAPLRLTRTLLTAGAAVLVGLGLLFQTDAPADVDPAAGRLAVALAAVALVGLTFVSKWVQRHALAIVYTFFAAVSGWQLGLAQANGLSPTSAFGLILVFIGCSAGFQTTRALALYSGAFVAATAVVAFSVPEPLVPRDAFLATLGALAVLGTFLFRTRHEAMQRLDAAREDALAAARTKSDFLATMSHEIRTPLNGVIGMTDVLATTPLSADQREALATIRASGDALLGVITDILDFSKIEAGRIELEAQPLSLRALVEDTLDVAAAAGRRQVGIVGHVRPSVPAAVVGDATRLRQILLNLISNAVKFTASGEIVVDVRAAVAHGTAEVHIAVTDSGIGIAADRLAGLFEPFVQVDASTTRRYGGTGLGLAISRRLAEQMGGRLWAESEPGRGSTFHLTLALPVGEAPAPDVPFGDGAPLLVVDDSAAATDALADLAREAGFVPHVAYSAEDALAFLAAGGRYAAAIVDHDLAGLSGLDAVERLRAHTGAGAGPILLAAPVGAAGRASRLVDGVVARPVRAAAFRSALRAALEPEAVPEPVARSMSVPDAAPLRVLLAEDHAVNQRVALGLLRHLGVDADVVETGRAAVAAVARGGYAVVLMDVQMPEMDGLDATRAIRASGGPQPVIVALTANAVSGDAERCLAAGMDAYLAKPLRLDALESALAAATGRTFGRPMPAPLAMTSPDGLPTPEHLLAHLRTLTEGDDALADEILAAYLDTDRALVDGLTHEATVAASAHKLKASSGTLGAVALAARADAVERAARAGRPTRASARDLADDLATFRDVVSDARSRLGIAGDAVAL